MRVEETKGEYDNRCAGSPVSSDCRWEDVVWAAMGGEYEGNRGRLSRYTDQNWCGEAAV